jgi:hypothetical protein
MVHGRSLGAAAVGGGMKTKGRDVRGGGHKL